MQANTNLIYFIRIQHCLIRCIGSSPFKSCTVAYVLAYFLSISSSMEQLHWLENESSLSGLFFSPGCGELMGCAQGRELGVRAGLAFRGLSCWEASLTLYLRFRFRPSLWLPFVGGFAVLKGLMTAYASLQPSCY